MYNPFLHRLIDKYVQLHQLDIAGSDNIFYVRLLAGINSIHSLYYEVYPYHQKRDDFFEALIAGLFKAYQERSSVLQKRDREKEARGEWFLSNELVGMSLYVDRFAGNLEKLSDKLPYLDDLGVNLIHVMPVFESPAGESDGGYAVSDFRKVDPRFGTLNDLKALQNSLLSSGKYLMLDIVLNHTSHKHEWAQKAKEGDKGYQDYYYTFDDRSIPDEFEKGMPEVFPESSPGNFMFDEQMGKWVMTVFHNYQWDLNFTNPAVLVAMMENIFFYANLGVDILRIDAPAFIWKEIGTNCQNRPKAHTLLRLIKQCVQVSTPGMALLGEAIVSPGEIMKYFGEGMYLAKECDFAYNATQMAVQWDAIASGNTSVMIKAQADLLHKPRGTSWITYTRCHDDIGLGYDDKTIAEAGLNPYQHRSFLKEFFIGNTYGSMASGALFAVNPKTNDARISGTLASLCGLEKALELKNQYQIDLAIRRIVLMQAHAMFSGGLPMLYYGDECGTINDYSYLNDPAKSYDNRWMHRPLIARDSTYPSTEAANAATEIFEQTKKLIRIRKELSVLKDSSNIKWMKEHNSHVAGFLRFTAEKQLYCVFNYHAEDAFLTWYAFKEFGHSPQILFDNWAKAEQQVGADNEYFVLPPYGFAILEPKPWQ